MHTRGTSPQASQLQRAGQLQSAASAMLVPLQVRASRAGAFRACIESACAGPVVVGRIRSAPHVVSREARSITSTDPELFKVTLHQRGQAIAIQDGHQEQVKPGDVVVFDTARPYRLALADSCDVVVIGVPRIMIGAHADRISRTTAMPLASDRGIRAILSTFLSSLSDHVCDLSSSAGPDLADALVALLIAGFVRTTAERVDTKTNLRDRIIAYVRANLADSTLSVQSVARRHGISVRYLHQLFQQQERTFAAWIRHERLLRIRRDLTDPAQAHLTTTTITLRWGISDPSHISRAVKAEFGRTTAELRDLGRRH